MSNETWGKIKEKQQITQQRSNRKAREKPREAEKGTGCKEKQGREKKSKEERETIFFSTKANSKKDSTLQEIRMSFINNLKPEEHRYLRRLVKEIHFQYFDEKHGASFVTNKMLDNVIENIGPEVAEAMIRTGVDKGDRL